MTGFFLFDLKSAYLQVPINENFTKWFGFGIEEEDGTKRFSIIRICLLDSMTRAVS